MNYLNQKTVKMQVKQPTHAPFIMINDDCFCFAARDLTGNGFKLYCYFLRWSGANQFFFSPKDVIKRMGLGNLQSVRNAVEDLKKHGYLKEEGVFLNFYAVPNEL